MIILKIGTVVKSAKKNSDCKDGGTCYFIGKQYCTYEQAEQRGRTIVVENSEFYDNSNHQTTKGLSVSQLGGIIGGCIVGFIVILMIIVVILKKRFHQQNFNTETFINLKIPLTE